MIGQSAGHVAASPDSHTAFPQHGVTGAPPVHWQLCEYVSPVVHALPSLHALPTLHEKATLLSAMKPTEDTFSVPELPSAFICVSLSKKMPMAFAFTEAVPETTSIFLLFR